MARFRRGKTDGLDQRSRELMMKSKHPRARYLAICLFLPVITGIATERARVQEIASVVLQTGAADCRVDFDSKAIGVTGPSGKITITDVDPGDHYLHVRCPGKSEATYFVSPQARAEIHLGPLPDAPGPPGGGDPSAVAENQTELRRLVQQAVQLRSQARLDEAVAALRQAMKLDPENADLHRELGITFLLAKEWKRARVEMLEALHHDPSNADAHNGLGYALEKMGNIDAAVREYRSATNLEPDDPTYRTHYLDALAKTHSRSEAKQ